MRYRVRWLDATQDHPRTAIISTSTEGAAYLLRACRLLYGNSSIGNDVFVSFARNGRSVQIQRGDAQDAIDAAERLCESET